jgi:hypothetical protein
MKRLSLFIIVLAAGVIGLILGLGFERFRNFETYVYPISLYSNRLHTLADQQKIDELTNDIILFDNAFAPKQVIDYGSLAKILGKPATNK